eukprot:TRINITY_DN6122_c0_g1_i2.p3 TRINITY_DN6122_c0_g1~~TRINITY_DN6122_c0_g1_i2.p3  ORF type:complete len:198 (-),score=-9.30 TRINITY_DN6122_c0_g1_i2:305-898(-)
MHYLEIRISTSSQIENQQTQVYGSIFPAMKQDFPTINRFSVVNNNRVRYKYTTQQSKIIKQEISFQDILLQIGNEKRSFDVFLNLPYKVQLVNCIVFFQGIFVDKYLIQLIYSNVYIFSLKLTNEQTNEIYSTISFQSIFCQIYDRETHNIYVSFQVGFIVIEVFNYIFRECKMHDIRVYTIELLQIIVNPSIRDQS